MVGTTRSAAEGVRESHAAQSVGERTVLPEAERRAAGTMPLRDAPPAPSHAHPHPHGANEREVNTERGSCCLQR